jgi:hypothetical protein
MTPGNLARQGMRPRRALPGTVTVTACGGQTAGRRHLSIPSHDGLMAPAERGAKPSPGEVQLTVGSCSSGED